MLSKYHLSKWMNEGLCNLNLVTHHFKTLCGLFQELKAIMYIECIAPKISSIINGS